MRSTNIKNPIRRFIKIGMFCVAVYLLLYIPNSIFGGYWGPVAGRMAWKSGLPISTLFLWQPFFGYSDSYNKSLLGWVYYPLILIDQNCIHHMYDITRKNDADIIFANPSQIRWNPQAEKIAKKDRLDKAIWRSHCVEDREFCLQSAENFHSSEDMHFIALLINDKYGTNALGRLQSLSEKAESEVEKKQINKVIQEVQKLNTKQLNPK